MARYTVTQNYRSGLGEYAEGDRIDLPDDFAAHINRDSPGTLAPLTDDPTARALDTPPADRMVRQARRRQDRQGDPSDQGAMTRADHKATRNKDD